MVPSENLELMWNIEVACRRCIQAAYSFDVSSKSSSNILAFTQNCYGAMCVIHWCQVFGTCSERTHFSRLFKGGTISCMTKAHAAARIWQSVAMNEEEYEIFWEGVVNARDKYLVHNDFDAPKRPIFPDLSILVNACLEMRSILRDIITANYVDRDHSLEDIPFAIKYYPNEMFLVDVKSEANSLEKDIFGGENVNL